MTVLGAGTDLHHADEIFLLAIGKKKKKKKVQHNNLEKVTQRSLLELNNMVSLSNLQKGLPLILKAKSQMLVKSKFKVSFFIYIFQALHYIKDTWQE